jgi:hypothetical protein
MNNKQKISRNIIKWMGIVIGLLGILCFINFIPTFNLETPEMKVIEGDWVNVYYKTEESAAQDVFAYADSEIKQIAQKLGFEEKQNVNIYIYDSQLTMQKKKYGLISSVLGLAWYIGDNIGTNVILTSPANPGPVHDYDTVKYAVLHEVVHAYISVINPRIHLWLTEGTALYLSNGQEFYKEYLEYMVVPSLKDTNTRNPIAFAGCNGYTYSTTYIEYLDVTYGWNKVLELIETENYEECLGKTQQEFYSEWMEYIANYYQ